MEWAGSCGREPNRSASFSTAPLRKLERCGRAVRAEAGTAEGSMGRSPLPPAAAGTDIGAELPLSPSLAPSPVAGAIGPVAVGTEAVVTLAGVAPPASRRGPPPQ